MGTLADYEESALSQRINLVPGSYRKDESTAIIRVTYKESYTSDTVFGAAVGVGAGLAVGGLAVAVGVALAFFPFGLIALAVVAIAVVAGGIIGGIIGSKKNYDRVKMFDSFTGEFLGEKAVEASRHVVVKAVDQFLKGDFDKAKKYFEAANVYEPNADHQNNIRACELAKDAQNLAKQNNSRQAMKVFEEAMQKATHSLMKDSINEMMMKLRETEMEGTTREREEERNRQNEENHRLTELNEDRVAREKERKVQEQEMELRMKINEYERTARKAEVKVKKGHELWNEAWELENGGKSAEAKEKFEQANQQFKEALEILPENEDIQNIQALVSLKIEGNQDFNEGVEAQKQGKELENEGKYQEAFAKYEEAAEKFNKAYETSGDKRFKRSSSIVEEQKTNLKQIMNQSLYEGVEGEKPKEEINSGDADQELEEKRREEENQVETHNQVDTITNDDNDYDFE